MKNTTAIRKALRKAINVPYNYIATNKYKTTRTVKFYTNGITQNDLCKAFNAISALNVGATFKTREDTNFYGMDSCIITVPKTY